MTFGGFTCASAVNANNGAGAVDLSVFRHCLALFMVLVFGMGTGTDGADNRVLGTRASGDIVA